MPRRSVWMLVRSNNEQAGGTVPVNGPTEVVVVDPTIGHKFISDVTSTGSPIQTGVNINGTLYDIYPLDTNQVKRLHNTMQSFPGVAEHVFDRDPSGSWQRADAHKLQQMMAKGKAGLLTKGKRAWHSLRQQAVKPQDLATLKYQSQSFVKDAQDAYAQAQQHLAEIQQHAASHPQNAELQDKLRAAQQLVGSIHSNSQNIEQAHAAIKGAQKWTDADQHYGAIGPTRSSMTTAHEILKKLHRDVPKIAELKSNAYIIPISMDNINWIYDRFGMTNYIGANAYDHWMTLPPSMRSSLELINHYAIVGDVHDNALFDAIVASSGPNPLSGFNPGDRINVDNIETYSNNVLNTIRKVVLIKAFRIGHTDGNFNNADLNQYLTTYDHITSDPMRKFEDLYTSASGIYSILDQIYQELEDQVPNSTQPTPPQQIDIKTLLSSNNLIYPVPPAGGPPYTPTQRNAAIDTFVNNAFTDSRNVFLYNMLIQGLDVVRNSELGANATERLYAVYQEFSGDLQTVLKKIYLYAEISQAYNDPRVLNAILNTFRDNCQAQLAPLRVLISSHLTTAGSTLEIPEDVSDALVKCLDNYVYSHLLHRVIVRSQTNQVVSFENKLNFGTNMSDAGNFHALNKDIQPIITKLYLKARDNIINTDNTNRDAEFGVDVTTLWTGGSSPSHDVTTIVSGLTDMYNRANLNDHRATIYQTQATRPVPVQPGGAVDYIKAKRSEIKRLLRRVKDHNAEQAKFLEKNLNEVDRRYNKAKRKGYYRKTYDKIANNLNRALSRNGW